MRESFVIHAEYIEDLPEEFKPLFLQYIYNYGIKGIEPQLTGLEASIWIKIKRRIDEETALYEKKCKNLRNVNKKHKTPSTIENELSSVEKPLSSVENEVSTIENAMSSNENELSSGEYVSDYESVNDSVIECESVTSTVETAPQAPQFVKPTLIDIQDYCNEKNINTDCEKFFYYYESKGWLVGDTPMQDWRSAIKKWAKNDEIYKKKPTRPASDTSPNILRQYSPPPKPDIDTQQMDQKIKQIQGVNDEELIF